MGCFILSIYQILFRLVNWWGLINDRFRQISSHWRFTVLMSLYFLRDIVFSTGLKARFTPIRCRKIHHIQAFVAREEFLLSINVEASFMLCRPSIAELFLKKLSCRRYDVFWVRSSWNFTEVEYFRIDLVDWFSLHFLRRWRHLTSLWISDSLDYLLVGVIL